MRRLGLVRRSSRQVVVRPRAPNRSHDRWCYLSPSPSPSAIVNPITMPCRTERTRAKTWHEERFRAIVLAPLTPGAVAPLTWVAWACLSSVISATMAGELFVSFLSCLPRLRCLPSPPSCASCAAAATAVAFADAFLCRRPPRIGMSAARVRALPPRGAHAQLRRGNPSASHVRTLASPCYPCASLPAPTHCYARDCSAPALKTS
eukprot:COSAG06_NODE_5408_length_3501_cov_2.526749_2_plen_205_part_00